MVQRRLNVLPGWDECDRCERHTHRLGVFAPVWPKDVKIVVLSVAATRASQAVGFPDPVLLDEVAHLRDVLGLSASECVADTLLACGLGTQPTGDHAAACAQRFVHQASRAAVPAVVVLRDGQTLAVARDAGLVDPREQRWHPVGGGRPSKLFVGSSSWGRTVRRLARELKITIARHQPFARVDAAAATAAADRLLGALEDHDGRATKTLHGGWQRERAGKLKVADVADHLAGKRYVAPFKPRFFWPYVVVDIDRHNAVQALRFDDTVKKAIRALPGALAVRSSASGGVHLYVRVRPGFFYKTAAAIVRMHLTLAGVRWARIPASGLRYDVELTEVPDQPTRLPFGMGSYLLTPGLSPSTLRLEDEVDAFVGYVKGKDFQAFAAAEKAVRTELGLKGAGWQRSKLGKVERWLLDDEVGDLPAVSLPANDPFFPLLAQLPPAVARVASAGVPAVGTRTRWMYRLIQHLADRAPPEEVERLLRHWLRSRSHQSTDIERDPRRVERQLTAMLTLFYRKRRGVPAQVWQYVAASVRSHFVSIAGTADCILVSWAGRTASLDALLDTAFLVLLRFFAGTARPVAIPWRTFEWFAGVNAAKGVRRFFESAGWLLRAKPGVPGSSSARYALKAGLAEASTGDDVLHVRPRDPKGHEVADK